MLRQIGYTLFTAAMKWEEISADCLFRACVDRDNAQAWTEFMRRFGLLIARTAFRTAQRWTEPEPDLVDDLVQEIYLKLCANDAAALRNFRETREGGCFAFLKVFTVNAVIDHFRSGKSTGRVALRSVSLESLADAIPYDEPLDRDIALREIQNALDRVTQGATRDRDRWVFLLYYRHGFSAKAIASIPAVGLSREGVESLLGRLTRALRRQFASASENRPGTGSQETGAII